MIDYKPFWATLKQKKKSTYYLIHKCHMSSSTIARLRRNMPISTVTLDDLCRFLDCQVEDIVRYIPNEKVTPSQGESL